MINELQDLSQAYFSLNGQIGSINEFANNYGGNINLCVQQPVQKTLIVSKKIDNDVGINQITLTSLLHELARTLQ